MAVNKTSTPTGSLVLPDRFAPSFKPANPERKDFARFLGSVVMALLLASCGAITIGGDPGYGGGGGTGTQLPETEMRTERIAFRRGSDRATVEGSIMGRQTVDYLLEARAGDYLNVSMVTDNSSGFFNIMEPGEMYTSIYTGSRSGRQFEGTARRSGDYRIRVYQMANSADRGERSNYRLEVIKSTNSGPSWGQEGDNFQASGSIPCSMGAGSPTGKCEFGVVRRGSGTADVTVFRPNGSRRVIYFQNGRAVGYDQSQADRASFSASKQRDLYIIRIGSERYEIPEAVIYGG